MIHKIINLILNDFKQIFRDKMMLIFLLAPFILLAFVRFFIPYLSEKYPFVVEYHNYIMMFAAMQTAIMFGCITSFMILEEKDENVFQVIRILPINTAFFIMYRIFFGFIFSLLSAFLLLRYGGIATPNMVNSFALALLYGLISPLITLVIGTFAKNKIEGLAFFKGLDLLLIIPILGFFVPISFKYLFGIVPIFWTFQVYDAALKAQEIGILFIIAFIIHIICIIGLSYLFQKKVFEER